MRHLTSNPIQELRRILKDQYSFSSIIKELIQNADDAGAREFHLGWVPDWPPGTHPLLTGPTMLCLNDGEFRKADARAIWHLDEGAKGGDVGTIGKYGLGMKSVFHLCEGFFYAASTDQPAAEGSPFVELLNPWPEDGPHNSWADTDRARSRIFECITKWKHGAKRWFCLAIPLRTPEHLDGAEAILPGQLPRIDDLLDSYEPHDLATLTTLLRFLTRITMWGWSAEAHALTVATQLTLDSTDLQRRSFPELAPGTPHAIRARVVSRSSSDRVLLRACGMELLDPSSAFVRLKEDPRWPKNFTLNPVTGRSEDALEKAEPHAAAVFTVREGQVGELRVRNAVFLPLSRGDRERVSSSGDKHFELLLHGLFFLDAGRRELYASDGRVESLQESWNKRLLREAVLPLVLPALNVFANAWSLPDDDMAHLTTALRESRLFGEYRHEICSSMSWIDRMDPADTGPHWGLVDSSERFFEMPSLSCRLATAASLFRVLPRLCRAHIIVEHDRPRLTLREATAWTQAEPVLLELLESLEPRDLSKRDALMLGADFLNLIGDEPPLPVIHVLAAKLRAVIAEQGVRALEQVPKEFESFVASVPQRSWVQLRWLEKDAVTLFRELNRLDLEHAILPEKLAPIGALGDRLSIDEAEMVCSWLKKTASQRGAEQTAAATLSVIAATEGTREQKLARLGETAVLLARGGGSEADHLTCWRDLEDLFENGRLFATGSTDLPLLMNALQDDLFSLYEPKACDAFKILFGAEPRRCTPAACIELLLTGPRLRSPGHREALFTRLLATTGAKDETTRRKSLRYLLHSQLSQLDDLDTVLLIGTSVKKHDPLSRVVEESLRRTDDAWRAVPEVLCRQANDNNREFLGIQGVNAHSLTDALFRVMAVQASLSWMAQLGLTADEAESVLINLLDGHLRALVPLHRVASRPRGTPGQYVALDKQKCFLAPSGDVVPFAMMVGSVVLIEQPADPRLLQLYYSEGVELWGPGPCLRTLLRTHEPHRHAIEILDVLTAIANDIPPDLRKQLQEVPWLPTRAGPVCPKAVVDLEQIEPELMRLMDLADAALPCVARVQVDWKSHASALAILRRAPRILPGVEESLSLLGSHLGTVPAFRLGEFRAIRQDPGTLATIAGVFRGRTGLTPALELLVLLFARYEDAVAKNGTCLANAVIQPADIDTLLQHVEIATAAASELQTDHNDAAFHVVTWFLEALAKHPEFTPAALGGVALRAKDGTWRRTRELCFHAEGIADSYLLDPELTALFPRVYQRILLEDQGAMAAHGRAQMRRGVLGGSAVVRYFDSWRGCLPRAHVGGFLALLGDDPDVLAEAGASLGTRSVRDVREQLCWESLEKEEDRDPETIHEVLARQRLCVNVVNATHAVRVCNILGGTFDAQPCDDPATLLLGDVVLGADGIPTITIREITPSHFSSYRLSTLLRESSRALLHDIYFRQSKRLDELWRQLGEATQLQVEIVQDVILEGAWIVMEQLGLRGMNGVRDLARRHDELERRRAEAQYSEDPGRVRDEVAQCLIVLNAELRELIETDAQVERALLTAVRQKMHQHYQYSLGSLPFEMLQNADDAAAELVDMAADLRSDASTRLIRIILHADDPKGAACTFVHWGRPINEFHRGSFSAEDGRRRGYDTDLRKMLLLAASDKHERRDLVTGKFGLGFKTVYFASDRPQVLSSDLGFEVVGGLFPCKLNSNTAEQLGEIMQEGRPGRRDGTVIRLPLTCNPVEIRNSLNAFIPQLPFMLAFSKCVNACELSYDTRATRVEWMEELIASRHVFTGRAVVQGDESDIAFQRALVFRDDAAGAVLLAIGPSGVMSFGPSVPVFWVSAPTRTECRAGLTVNGSFRVDPGRTQLARERDGSELDENVQIARRLGVAVGEGLIGLFDAIMASWDTLREQLGLNQELASTEFWISAWRVLVQAGGDGHPLLWELIWGSDCGLARVLSQRESLPTLLSGQYARLTRPSAVRAVVEGLLDKEEVFQHVCSWQRFSEKYDVGALISRSRVLSELGNTDVMDPPNLARITLESAIRLETGEPGVSIEVAARVGSLVTRMALHSWECENSRLIADELAALRSALRELRFRARSGDWVSGSELLVPQSVPADVSGERADEWRRAAFAPADRVLGDEYSDAAAEFVLACRGAMSAPAELLAQWVLYAETDSCSAALRYLLDGRLASEVARIVRERRERTWVATLTRAELKTLGFSEDEQFRILALTGASGEAVAQMYLTPVSPFIVPACLRTGKVLQALSIWWSAHAPTELMAYNTRTYPDGKFPVHVRDDCDLDRAGWLRLFLLGCTRSMGPFTDEQHREFLRLCDSHGWIENLANIELNRHAWLACWDQYIDGQVDRIRYFQWMKNLLGLSVVARFLPEYADAFLAVNRMRDGFALDQITTPRASPEFSGGGPDAPPTGQIVGVGQCFIMRELVRHRVIESTAAHRWCYVPLRQVRELIRRLGGPEWTGRTGLWRYSADIHGFMSDHVPDPTFGLSFDIPLRLVAERPELWRELVDEQPPEHGVESDEEWQ